MEFTQLLVVHVAGPLRQPEVRTRHNGVDRTGYQYIMEVRDDKVSIMILEVDWSNAKHQTGEATDREKDDEPDSKQHRCLKRHRALPHRRYPVEHLHAGRYRNQHGGIHEEQIRLRAAYLP